MTQASFKVKLFDLIDFLDCVGAALVRDIEAWQKHELQEQHFVNGQGLDLYLKKFENDFAKNKMAP